MDKGAIVDEETIRLEIQGNYEYAPGIPKGPWSDFDSAVQAIDNWCVQNPMGLFTVWKRKLRRSQRKGDDSVTALELWCSKSKSSSHGGAKGNNTDGSETTAKQEPSEAEREAGKKNGGACTHRNGNNSQAATTEDAENGDPPCQWRVTLRRNRNNNKIYLDRMPNTGHNHTLAEESSKVPKRRMATRRNAGQVSTPDDVIQEGQRLVAELCRGFYELGWVSGTGGSISIKVSEDRICMAPSGVQKERMQPEDIYVLSGDGEVVQVPVAKPPPYKPPKLSECHPLFMIPYRHRGSGAVIHSHSIHAVMATMLDPNATEFRITQLEMIKGIKGCGFYDVLVVPIIENTARECELTESLEKAVLKYPETQAVLVRRHGIYVWGDNWIQAKTQAECYHYLFEAACKMKAAGIPYQVAPSTEVTIQNTNKRQKSCSLPKAIVLDIEGTTTPLSFTKDVLFPYARANVRQYLKDHFRNPQVISAVSRLSELLATDKYSRSEEILQNLIIPDYKDSISSEEIDTTVGQVVSYIEYLMDSDRKAEPLKTLQGYIWEEGYHSGKLKGEIFEDVPKALTRWVESGIRVYIYSSGSRQAQRLLFEHTPYGDLTPSLSGYFDTTVGNKQSSDSYQSIKLSIGSQNSDEPLFLTDKIEEAKAASSSGFKALIVNRPGNEQIFEEHSFEIIKDFDTVC